MIEYVFMLAVDSRGASRRLLDPVTGSRNREFEKEVRVHARRFSFVVKAVSRVQNPKRRSCPLQPLWPFPISFPFKNPFTAD